MKISKKAEYGLSAMVHLAKGKNKKAISIREISRIEGVPYEFLCKIFAVLEKAKLVSSKYGANGGYYLAKPAQKISIQEIVNALEKTTSVDCGCCQNMKNCLTKIVWRKMDSAIEKTLKSIKLAELIK